MKQLTEQEKREMLLKPRYKVIADWPEMRDRFKGNPIITMDRKDEDGFWTSNGHYLESFFTDYPHLFRKLEWWEERKVEDMPEYVGNAHGVYKVDQWRASNTYGWWFLNDSLFKMTCRDHSLTPATLEEYNTYLSKQD